MLNSIDLFAGCGGLTEGFKKSNKFQMLAAIEWDVDALNTLKSRLKKKYSYPDTNERCILFDIQKVNKLIDGFDSDKYSSHGGLKALVASNKVDVIIGGPPCQAYSVAGRIRDENGMHDDYRNYLFESYMRVVDIFQPDAFIFENVPGMLSAAPGGIPIIDRITKSFKKSGYTVSNDLKNQAMFDVSEFGVPQKRKRVIIAGFRNKSFINAKKKVDEFYLSLMKKKHKKVVTVGEALKELPRIFPIDSTDKRKSHEVRSFIKHIYVSDHEPRFHNKRDVGIFKLLAKDIEDGVFKYASSDALKQLYTKKTGKVSSVHKYHVLRSDMPSNTIPAHLYKDGLRHIHPDPEQARSITVREAARLQSFPDDFEFLGSNGSKYKMIGNAVPPLFAEKIALTLAQTIKEKKNAY